MTLKNGIVCERLYSKLKCRKQEVLEGLGTSTFYIRRHKKKKKKGKRRTRRRRKRKKKKKKIIDKVIERRL